MPSPEMSILATPSYDEDGVVRIRILATHDLMGTKNYDRVFSAALSALQKAHPEKLWPAPVVIVEFACGCTEIHRHRGNGGHDGDVPN